MLPVSLSKSATALPRVSRKGIELLGLLMEVIFPRIRGENLLLIEMKGHPFDSERGSFAEYVAIKGDLAFQIPPHFSFEEAATLPCGIATVGIGFYRYLEIPLPTLPIQEGKDNGEYLLIYGGSSATGTLAIQFAKL